MGSINNRTAGILLADDDPGDQELTRRALKKSDIKNSLYIVQDGEEALDFFVTAEYTGIRSHRPNRTCSKNLNIS